jgi:hypothetical protein
MSFYNVANPTQFYIYKQDQFGLVDQGKIVRIPSTQLFTGAATTASFSLTANQLINGNLIINAGATGSGYAPTGSAGITVTLPSATDLITLLMGPGGFDVSSNDIFMLRVHNTSAAFKLYIAPGTDGIVGANSYAKLNLVPPFPVVTYSSELLIPIQISISTVAGVTTYGYTLL